MRVHHDHLRVWESCNGVRVVGDWCSLAQASETEQAGNKMSDSHGGYYSKVSNRESLVDTLAGLTFFSAEIGLWQW